MSGVPKGIAGVNVGSVNTTGLNTNVGSYTNGGTGLYVSGSPTATKKTSTQYVISPVSTSGGSTSSIGSYSGTTSTGAGDAALGVYNQKVSAINTYIDSLLKNAQGDYDYAAKWIEANYKKALGTNDQATAEFLKSVASTLEATSGRVVYDYQTGKYFLDKTTSLAETQTKEAQKSALARLAEDEKISTEELKRNATLEKQQLDTNLNQRGLISAPRDQQGGIAGQSIGLQNEDIAARQSAIERLAQRGTQDVNTSAINTLDNLALANEKGLESLTTTARREGIDAQQLQQQQIEAAALAKKKAEAAAEAQRQQELTYAKSYSTQKGSQLI